MYYVKCKTYEERERVFEKLVCAVNHTEALVKAFLEWDACAPGVNLMELEDFVFEVFKASPTAGKNRTIELSDGCRIRVKEDGTMLELSSIA